MLGRLYIHEQCVAETTGTCCTLLVSGVARLAPRVARVVYRVARVARILSLVPFYDNYESYFPSLHRRP